MDLQINIHADDAALKFAQLVYDAAKMMQDKVKAKGLEGPIPEIVTVLLKAEPPQVVDTAPEPIIEPIESDPLPDWTTNTDHDEPAAKVVSVADVRAAAKEFLDKRGAEGGAALKHLLQKFGAAKVGALKPEDCAPFMDALLDEMGVAANA